MAGLPLLPLVNGRLREILPASRDDGYADAGPAAARWSGDVGVYVEESLATESRDRGVTETEQITMVLEAGVIAPAPRRGEWVRFTSRGGEQVRRVRATKTLEPGLTFMTFHP